MCEIRTAAKAKAIKSSLGDPPCSVCICVERQAAEQNFFFSPDTAFKIRERLFWGREKIRHLSSSFFSVRYPSLSGLVGSEGQNAKQTPFFSFPLSFLSKTNDKTYPRQN